MYLCQLSYQKKLEESKHWLLAIQVRIVATVPTLKGINLIIV